MTPVLTRPDRTGRIAAEAYRQMARRLNAEASRQDRSGRPLTARLTREKARIAMKAAWAEETNVTIVCCAFVLAAILWLWADARVAIP